jgi:lipopolysaccharide/colanic/teichoic acid biosynthesis glycosyltransferase
MNANVGENNIVAENTIVEQELKEKTDVRKAVYGVFKRIIDILGGFVGVILLIPVTIGVYIARKILKEDDGPLFYEQLRYGKDGKKFRIYKFRSMCVDADKKLKEYLANNDEARKEFEENQKLKNDPRITKIGDFLRKTSIDELPQLINVLKGEMSLIGPRPIVDGEIEKYGTNKDKFLSVKPGLTGYWAANGRNNITYSERIKMELYYVDNMSFGLDLNIFLKTIVSVIKKEGAN